jgi:hypothetical protein
MNSLMFILFLIGIYSSKQIPNPEKYRARQLCDAIAARANSNACQFSVRLPVDGRGIVDYWLPRLNAEIVQDDAASPTGVPRKAKLRINIRPADAVNRDGHCFAQTVFRGTSTLEFFFGDPSRHKRRRGTRVWHGKNLEISASARRGAGLILHAGSD